ncbi:MAG: hypothetical protein SXQ77_12200, partial [Halobacteria archaeon]|nr:hypothetical protein [Halobacteria archaeon]
MLVGVIGFTVWGTLYHIVPFIIWVHRYSDRLGLEEVPMVDDLYDARLAKLDFWLLVVGGVTTLVGTSPGVVSVVFAGGILTTAGVLVFVGIPLFCLGLAAPETDDASDLFTLG